MEEYNTQWSSKDAQKLIPTIVYCSSEDPHFPVTELGKPLPSTRGWQSEKHCSYPQQIGFRFDGEVYLDQVQLLAHEAKIPQRIEIHIGEASNGEAVFPAYELVPFRRLGHVAYGNNAQGHFKSGELKAAAIGCRALFIKLLFWEPHDNPLNFYRQVGLSTMMCIGKLVRPYATSGVYPHQRSTIGGVRLPDSFASQRAPEIIRGVTSPLDALQYDLAYDPVVVGKIKELSEMKQRAEQFEDYESAARLKNEIATLYPLGSRIQELEMKKKQAALEEDYQYAAALKNDIEELRAAAACVRVGLAPPIVPSGFAIASPEARSHDKVQLPPLPVLGNQQFALQNTPQRTMQPALLAQQNTAESPVLLYHYHNTPKPAANNAAQLFDEMPAVATGAASEQFENGMVPPPKKKEVHITKNPVLTQSLVHFDQIMASHIVAKAPSEGPPENISAQSTKFVGYDHMTAALGVYTTACLFSKRYQLQEAATTVLCEKADAVLQHCDSTEVAEAMMYYLSNPGFGVTDPVPSVFYANAEMLHRLCAGEFQGNCTEVLRKHHYRILPALVQRTGDSNPKVRGVAKELLHALMMTTGVGIDAVCETIAEDKGRGFRLFASRLEVIEETILNVIKDQSWEKYQSLALKFLMNKMVMPGLQHAHAAVRDKSIDVLILLYRHYGSNELSPYLDKLKPSQRAVVEKRIESDSSPPAAAKKKAPLRVRHAVEEARNSQENESPPAKTNKSSLNKEAYAPPKAENPTTEEELEQEVRVASVRKKLEQARASDLPAKPARRQPPAPIHGQCQFCGLEDESFEDHRELVQHFMAECPMLCTCPLCQLPVEIREVHWHLAEDCEERSKVKQCPRCFETVRADEYEAHIAKKACTAFQEAYQVCPLCHESLPSGDVYWEAHILNPPYCPGNPRSAN